MKQKLKWNKTIMKVLSLKFVSITLLGMVAINGNAAGDEGVQTLALSEKYYKAVRCRAKHHGFFNQNYDDYMHVFTNADTTNWGSGKFNNCPDYQEGNIAIEWVAEAKNPAEGNGRYLLFNVGNAMGLQVLGNVNTKLEEGGHAGQNCVVQTWDGQWHNLYNDQHRTNSYQNLVLWGKPMVIIDSYPYTEPKGDGEFGSDNTPVQVRPGLATYVPPLCED